MNPQQQDPASPLRSDTLFSDTVPTALKRLVDRYGAELLAEPVRLRGLLADEAPQARKEISVLLQALEERVPQDLMRVHSGESASSLTPRLVRRLTEEKAVSTEAAHWAVNAWAHGMGLDAIVHSQPAKGEPGFTGTVNAAGMAGFTVAKTAANSIHDSSQPIPAPVPTAAASRSSLKAQVGAGVLAMAALAGAGWWYLTPKLEIERVETNGVLIGNGKPQPIFIDFNARNVQVRSAQVHLVKGGGNWSQTSWTVDATQESPHRVSAGTLAVTTSTPISATFEYVLVGADGKKSEPFQRTFDIVPPLVITKIEIPKSLQIGREFALNIGFQKSSAEIVRIERKVIQSDQTWAQNETAQQIQPDPNASSLTYKFEPFAKPTKAMLEFALVDAAGVRSEPYKVALNVGAVVPGMGPGTVVAVRMVRNSSPAKSSSGVGAVLGGIAGAILGNQVGGGTGRAVATIAGGVGGAWAGNEVEKRYADHPDALYQTTIRFDDGSTRTITTHGAPRWREGTRVKWDGHTLTPLEG
jgi:outer membrane lipoprotein SlyB